MNYPGNPSKIISGAAVMLLFMVGCDTPAVPPTATHVASVVTNTPQPTTTFASPQPPTQTQQATSQVTANQTTESKPVAILQGKFEGVGRGHTGSGTATIYQRSDGSYLLKFKDFSVCCGPDLYVYLVRKSSSAENIEDGNYIELSSLTSITGDQDYEIPASIDLSQVKSVVVYCKPYQVVISTATLRCINC